MSQNDRPRRRNQDLGTLDVALDIGLDHVHLVTDLGEGLVRRQVANRSDELHLMCVWLDRSARTRGYSSVRLIAEPTGIYHELPFSVARRHGFQTRTVQAEAVKKNRVVMFGDYGKTDLRDPEVILDLARRDRLIPSHLHRGHEIFRALRCAGVLYARAERDAIRAKCRIHRARHRVFPDFKFSSDFVFSASGHAVMQVSGFDPHTIARIGRSRFAQRVRRLAPRIQRRSVDRICAAAALSAESIPSTPASSLILLELRQAWDDLHLAEARKAEAARHLLDLYDQARLLDPTLPAPQPGVVSKLSLARLVAETGPWSQFASVSQLLKFVGLNLFERQSGRWRGKTRISKKGRTLARHVLTQIVVPLVRRNRLLGDFHHHKTKVEKKPGPVAITAAARKILNVLFGWARSGRAFDPARVFVCQSQIARAA